MKNLLNWLAFAFVIFVVWPVQILLILPIALLDLIRDLLRGET